MTHGDQSKGHANGPDEVCTAAERKVEGKNRELRHAELESSRRTWLRPYHTANMHRGFERQFFETLPNLDGKLSLHEHRLHDSCTIADDGEGYLSRRTDMGHPTSDGDTLSDVLTKVGYARGGDRISHEGAAIGTVAWRALRLPLADL